MKKLELAHLKYVVREALSETKVRLARDHRLEPFARIIHADHGVEKANLDGKWLDSGRMKDMLFETMAAYCRKKEAPGFVMITDGWTLEQTPEQLKRFETDPAWLKEFEETTRNDGGVPAAAAKGFGRLREVIQCTGQSEDDVWSLAQMYERMASDGTIPPTAVRSGHQLPPHKIRFVGAPKVLSSEKGLPYGRMFSLYKGGANVDFEEPIAEKVEEMRRRAEQQGMAS